MVQDAVWTSSIWYGTYFSFDFTDGPNPGFSDSHRQWKGFVYCPFQVVFLNVPYISSLFEIRREGNDISRETAFSILSYVHHPVATNAAAEVVVQAVTPEGVFFQQDSLYVWTLLVKSYLRSSLCCCILRFFMGQLKVLGRHHCWVYSNVHGFVASWRATDKGWPRWLNVVTYSNDIFISSVPGTRWRKCCSRISGSCSFLQKDSQYQAVGVVYRKLFSFQFVVDLTSPGIFIQWLLRMSPHQLPSHRSWTLASK